MRSVCVCVCVCVCLLACVRASIRPCGVCACISASVYICGDACMGMRLCISHLFVCVCICNISHRIWCSVHTLTMEHILLCACGLAHVSWSISECILCLCRCCIHLCRFCIHHCTQLHTCTSNQHWHFSFPDRTLQLLHCCGICQLVCLPVLACCHHCPGTSVCSGSCQS